MIDGISPLAQAAVGTLFTWSLTAAGAAVVVFFSGVQMKLLHSSLGFAAGVMLAASYWSLLSPAIEMAEQSKIYGLNGEYAFLPVSVGFLLGGLFVYLTDMLITSCGIGAPEILLAMQSDVKQQLKKKDSSGREHSISQPDVNSSTSFRRKVTDYDKKYELPDSEFSNAVSEVPIRPSRIFSSSDPTSLNREHSNYGSFSFGRENPRSRSFLKSYPKLMKDEKPRFATISNSEMIHDVKNSNGLRQESSSDSLESVSKDENALDQWKRIVLLIVAITVHNIPEGLAVGVGFGAIGSSPSATFENARNLAIGIGIQNFPEGLAVSLPLKAVGFSMWKSFWYGQLSGMVEPIFGILGALAVSLAKPLLPYALSFAAGAMIYVVVDDIIPEANSDGRGKLATSATIIGFVVMMALDVGLGG